jgi:hypothetical protein
MCTNSGTQANVNISLEPKQNLDELYTCRLFMMTAELLLDVGESAK